MARLIQFYIPSRFKPKMKRNRQEQRGRLVLFPSALRKLA